MKNVLVACEESQAVTIEFRKLGFNAYSCDLQPCLGNHPEWHIMNDVLKIINDNKWDCMIGFPPCTHLAVSGAAWFQQKKMDGRQDGAIHFFMQLINAPIKHIAIENPIGIMSNVYRKPNQIIHPYYFGDAISKKTCLWLKNLPLLYHNENINLFDDKITHVKPELIKFKNGNYSGPCSMWYKDAETRSKERSKTYPGIAKAMAIQWGNFLINGILC